MYICLCNGLTDRDIRSAADGGARSVAAVYRAHECAPQCGKCGCHIKDMLREDAGGACAGGNALLAPSEV